MSIISQAWINRLGVSLSKWQFLWNFFRNIWLRAMLSYDNTKASDVHKIIHVPLHRLREKKMQQFVARVIQPLDTSPSSQCFISKVSARKSWTSSWLSCEFVSNSRLLAFQVSKFYSVCFVLDRSFSGTPMAHKRWLWTASLGIR